MNKKIFFITITAVFLALPLFIACSKKGDSGASDRQTTKIEQQKDIYTCPMHPQIKKDEPGQCPICGMNLIKAEQPMSESPQTPASPDGHASFNLPSARSQMIGVKLGIVERKPLFRAIRAAGRLAYDPELYTAQNEYVEALKQLESVKSSPVADVRQSARRMVDSARLRLKILGLSDKQIEGMNKADTTDASLLLNKAGQDAWVYADVYEMDLPHIRPGLAAEVSAGFLAGKVLVGKVVSVDRMINPATRTAKARVLISDARALLRPETYVDVYILSSLGEQITVPFDSIFDTGRQAWVFVADGKGKYEPRLITVKFYADDEAAIASGLKEGEQIVTSANFLIDSESRLKGAMGAPSKSRAPSCPKGQHWDYPMKMCMPNVGG